MPAFHASIGTFSKDSSMRCSRPRIAISLDCFDSNYARLAHRTYPSFSMVTTTRFLMAGAGLDAGGGGGARAAHPLCGLTRNTGRLSVGQRAAPDQNGISGGHSED